MTCEIFEQRLAQLGPEDEDAIAHLVAEYLRDITDGLSVLVRYASDGVFVGPKALSVLTQLKETVVRPLGRAIGETEAAPQAWMLFEMARGMKTAEDAAKRRLTMALRDARRVEPPDTSMLEEKQPSFRVCDEAYLALRRLFNSESFIQFSLESRHFLGLPDEHKNQEIENYAKKQGFTRFLDNVDEEEN